MTDLTPDFLQQTETILALVVEEKAFETGFNFINDIHKKGEEFSRAIAIMFAGMESVWIPSEHEGETFLQAAIRRTPFSAETIKRHTTVQWLLDSDKIPDQFRPQIEAGTQNVLERIANVVKEDFELGHDDWLRLSEKAKDERAVGNIVREIRKVPPRSNWLMGWIDEKGVLWAQTKDEGLVQAGRLEVFSESPAVKKLILRMTNCSGIKPRVEF